MPTAEMQAIRDSLNRAEALTGEVRRLRLQNRLIKGVVAAVLVVALFAGAVALYARSAADKAQDAFDTSKAQVALIFSEACRARNAANAATRSTFEANVDAFNHAFGALVKTPEAQANLDQIIKELRDAIPAPSKMDRDCTVPADGLGSDDYPP